MKYKRKTLVIFFGTLTMISYGIGFLVATAYILVSGDKILKQIIENLHLHIDTSVANGIGGFVFLTFLGIWTLTHRIPIVDRIYWILFGSIGSTMLLAFLNLPIPTWLGFLFGIGIFLTIDRIWGANFLSTEKGLLNKLHPTETIDQDAEAEIIAEQRIRDRYNQMLERVQNTDFLYIDTGWLEDKYQRYIDNTSVLSQTTVGGEVSVGALGTGSSAKAERTYTQVAKGLIAKYESVLTRLNSQGLVHIGIELPMVTPSNPQRVEALLLELRDLLGLDSVGKDTKKDMLEVAVAVKRLSNIQEGQYVFLSDNFTVTKKGEDYLLSYTHPVAKVKHTGIVIVGEIPKSAIKPENRPLFERSIDDEDNNTLKLTVLGLVAKSTVKTSVKHPEIFLLVKAIQF